MEFDLALNQLAGLLCYATENDKHDVDRSLSFRRMEAAVIFL